MMDSVLPGSFNLSAVLFLFLFLELVKISLKYDQFLILLDMLPITRRSFT